MKMIPSKILVLLILLTSCGFKVVDKSKQNNFFINKINTEGDRRVNFILKNELLNNSVKNSQNQIRLDINSKKVKTIKEKNIKNQVTKYEINLNIDLKVKFANTNREFNVSSSSNGDYSVADNYSSTLSNEKKLIENLVENISEDILKKIGSKINDL
tara:strand:- start:515 stop:985 length:471 start_codon:yes stop_codon:yes gene_type:complete